jgi:hypothetical protein
MSKDLFNTSDDFAAAVALGLVNGMEPIGQSGFSKVLIGGTETDVSLLVADTIPLPSNTGQTIQIWSNNVADTTQQIQVSGLGANGVLIDPQVKTLNGTTPVDLDVPMSRINDALNISNDPTLGDVNIGVSPTTIFSEVRAGFQRSKQAIFSIPVGHVFILPAVTASFRRATAGSVFVLMTVKSKRFEQNFYYDDIEFEVAQDGTSFAKLQDVYPKGIIGPADVKISARSNGTDARVLARINGLLAKVNND